MPESYGGWTPDHKGDGSVEITTACADGNGRFPLTTLTPRQYLEKWKTKDLRFRAEGKAKPDHLPDLDQVTAFLEQSGRSKPAASAGNATLREAVENTARMTGGHNGHHPTAAAATEESIEPAAPSAPTSSVAPSGAPSVSPEPLVARVHAQGVALAEARGLELAQRKAEGGKTAAKPAAPAPKTAPPVPAVSAPVPGAAKKPASHGADSAAIVDEYRKAALSILSRREEPKAEALAEALTLPLGIVEKFLGDQPAFVAEIADLYKSACGNVRPPAKPAVGPTKPPLPASARKPAGTPHKPPAGAKEGSRMTTSDKVAEKIGKLDDKKTATLTAVMAAGWRGQSDAAKKLKLTMPKLRIEMKSIFEEVGLEGLELKEQRKLLADAWKMLHSEGATNGAAKPAARSARSTRNGANGQHKGAGLPAVAPHHNGTPEFGMVALAPGVMAIPMSPALLRSVMQAGGMLLVGAANEGGISPARAIFLDSDVAVTE